MPPYISVLVPTYNRAGYLKRCLESVLSYTGDDLELIVQDNCSPDTTPEVVAHFTDPRLKYFRNDRNIGLSGNLIEIAAKASGEYVLYLTDDDILLPGAVDTVKKFLQLHQPDGFKSAYFLYREQSNTGKYVSYFNSDIAFPDLSDEQVGKIFASAHVLTGMGLRRDRLDFDYLRQHGDNWYPHMLALGMTGRKVGYLALPIAVHTWENETFWGVDPDQKRVLEAGLTNILLALEPKLEEKIYRQILISTLVHRRFLEPRLLDKLPVKEARALRKQIKRDEFRAFVAEKLRQVKKLL